MVDERFKINLEVDLDQTSLDRLSKKLQKQLFSDLAKVTEGLSASLKKGVAGGASAAATTRSIAQVVEIDASQAEKRITKALAAEITGMGATLKPMIEALKDLNNTLNRAKRGTRAPGDAPSSKQDTTETNRLLSRLVAVTEKLEQSFKAQARTIVKAQATAESATTVSSKQKAETKLLQEEAKLEDILEKLRKVRQKELEESRKLEKAQRELAAAVEDEAKAHRENAKRVRAAGAAAPPAAPKPGKAPKASDTTPSVAAKQVGSSNINRGANIEATHAGGSQRVGGSGGSTPKAAAIADSSRVRDGRKGTPEDKPQYFRSQEKSMAARERVTSVQQGAEIRARSVTQTLDMLRKLISSMSGFQGMAMGDIFRKINLPSEATVGTGAAPLIEDLSGQIKIVKGSITLFGSEIEKISTVISDRVADFAKAGGDFEKIERMARRDPERAISVLKGKLRDVFAAPGGRKDEVGDEFIGQPRKGYQKGGEFMLRYKPTDEEKQLLASRKNEADVIAEVNRLIYERIKANEKLAQTLKAFGIETIGSTGLAEQTAADIKIRKSDAGDIEEIQMPVQTRALQDVGVGGAGGVRWARQFLVSEISSIVGGSAPKVKGHLEEALLEAGVMIKQGFKEYLTVLADPDLLPEIREDQFLYDPKVVDMAMKEMKSTVVRSLAGDITPGAQLREGQVLGTRGVGADLEQVKAKLTGTLATVERIEPVFIDGVQGFKVIYQELNRMVSGAKLVEQSGIKGIGRAADLQKMGYPEGTGVVMSLEGLVKRHGLRTVIEMMANAISDATGKSAQQVADRLAEGAEEAGANLKDVIKSVAAEFGAEGFTGTMKLGKGPLAKAAGGEVEMIAGRMAWGRAPREGETGELKVKERYIDPAAMQALRSRTSTAAMAEEWSKNMKATTSEHDDLIMTLRALSGEVEATTMSLRRMRSSDIKPLPGVGAGSAELRGTLLDPDLGEAFAMSLPARGGGERLLRVPGLGEQLGQRQSYTSGVGTKGPNPIAVALDRIREQAEKVRGAMGAVDLEPGSDAMREASEVTAAKIKQITAAIIGLGQVTESNGKKIVTFSGQGEAAARAYIAAMMSIIQGLGAGPAGIQYKGRGGQIQPIRRSAADYVSYMDEKKTRSRPLQGQLLAIQDILAERGLGTDKANVSGRGRVHTDVGTLAKVMQTLEIQLGSTSEAAEDAFNELDRLERQYLEMATKLASARKKPASQDKRSVAASAEAGVSFAPMGTTLEFRTEVSKELNAVGRMLNTLSSQGYDTAQALSALDRVKAAQKVDLPAIDRDTVLINKKDFNKLVNLFSERLNITETESRSRLLRTGLAQRYPITGEQSFMAAKLRPVEDEVVPQGKLGVAGTMAISSEEDLRSMLGPLQELESRLLKVASESNYQGKAAQEAGAQLQKLSPVLDKLRMEFVAAALNLDFDGDKIAFHADMADKASTELKTFVNEIDSSTVSYRKALTQVLAATKGTGGPNTTLDLMDAMFRGGKAKGRPAEFQQAMLWPASGERAQFEAQAHTAPKKSVGLLTDAFNEMFLAVKAGTGKMSDSMATGMGQMMLGMNEALAQKHGGGGEAGPQEFLKMMKKGQLDQIFEAMKIGGTFVNKLAKQSEQVQTRVERDLQRLANTAGAEGLGKFIKKEGLGIEVDPSDLNKTIADILRESDLKNIIIKVFENLKKNMVSALVAGGATLGEAQGQMLKMLTPDEGGKIPGLDTKRIVDTMFPGYGMTRSRGQTSLKEMDPTERARKIIGLKGKSFSEELDLSELRGLGATAESARQGIIEFIKALKSSGGVKFLSTAQMQERWGTAGGGAFMRGSQTEGGAEGTIFVNKDEMASLSEASRLFKEIASGNLQNVTPEKLQAVQKQLQQFFGVLEHESIHKASKQWTSAVDLIVQELSTGSGVIGKNAALIYKSMKTTSSAFRDSLSKYSQLQKMRPDERVYMAKRVQDEATGEWGFKRTEMSVEEARGLQKQRMQTSVAEELMAYTAEPEKFQERFGNLPEEAQNFLRRQVEALRQASGSEGNMLRLVSDAKKVIAGNLFDSMIQASAASGPGDLRPEAEQLAVAAGDFPDVGKVTRALEVLEAHEKAILASSGLHKGLSGIRRGQEGTLERMEGEPTGLRLGGMEELQNVSNRIKAINQQIIDGVPDPETLDRLNKEIMKAARAARAKINAMAKDPALKEAMGGVKGQDEYANVIREFQRNVATTFSQKARDLQSQMAQMESLGMQRTPEFSAISREFINTIMRMHNWASETLAVKGTGRGTTASYLTSIKGEMLPAAREAGVQPTAQSFESVMEDVAGSGAEGQRFLEKMRQPIAEMVNLLGQGEDPLMVWNRMFQQLAQYPEDFKVDLNKVIEIMAKFSRMLGMSNGQFSKLSQAMQEVVGSAREISKATRNLRIGSTEDIFAAAGGAGKRPRMAAAQGAGASFEASINAQYANIEKLMRERTAKLNSLIKTPGYQAGPPTRQFESMDFQIIDPESGAALEKYRATFKRTRQGIVSGLEQIKDASNSLTKSTGMAIRRVLQWGFASGIVYGTIRMFRQFVDVIRSVEDGMAELKKVMDTSVTDFDQLQDAATGMASGFGRSIDQVLEGMTVYAQQGLKVNEVLDRTKATMLAVNTTTLSSAEATEALTAVMKLFDDELDSSESAIDAWAAVASKHAITAKDLALAVQRSGAAAKTAGVSFEDFLGITTAIGSVTRQSGKEVATGTKFMFRAMRSPQASKELIGLGIAPQTPTGEMRDTMSILGDVAGRWDELSQAQKLSIAQSMAGVRHYNQFIVLMENFDEVLSASADAQNSQGFAARKNAIAMQTFSRQLQSMIEEIKKLALDAGKAFLPTMKLFVGMAKTAVGAFNAIPDSIKAVGLAAAITGASLSRVGHEFLDLVDIMGGTGWTKKIREGLQSGGLIGGVIDMAKKAGGSFTSVFSSTASKLKPTEFFKGAKQAMVMPTALKDVINTGPAWGPLASGIYKVRAAISSMGKAAKIASSAGIIGLVTTLGLLTYNYLATAKTGKEMEEAMFDQIGVMQDQVSSLEMQERSLQRTSLAWKKYQSAVKVASDPARLGESMEAGEFKGPQMALEEYQETVSDVNRAMALLGTAGLQGISESGDYIYDASSAMNELAISATDAKKASLAALQTDVIKAYADELGKARTGWDKIKEAIGLGPQDMLSELEDSRKAISQTISDLRNDEANGILTSVAAQERLNEKVKEESALRGDVALVAQGLKKSLESLPTFDNAGLARDIIGSKDISEAAAVAARGGAFGRGATGTSVQMRLLSKNLGLGGVVEGRSTANIDLFREQLVDKGLSATQGKSLQGGVGAGAIGLLSQDMAKQLVSKFSEGLKEGADLDAAAQQARVVFTGVDDITGELIYYFGDSLKGVVGEVKQSELGPEMARAMGEQLFVVRQRVQEQFQENQRLFSLQGTGALAGIRIPKSGMPNLGPATARELTIDQRVLGALPEEMQRLSEVQEELSQITKRYNEDIQGSIEGNENLASGLKSDVNLAGRREKMLFATLKAEEFALSKMGLMQTAIAKLGKTLDDAAKASRDAAIEEETRAELLKETSGAFMGRAAPAQLDFGKTFRELSGQERLQYEMGPSFTRTMSQVAGMERQYQTDIQTTAEIRKQTADFNEMMNDLENAEGKLNEGLKRSLTQKATGADPGQQMIIEAISSNAQDLLSETTRQTSVMEKMLGVMGVQADVAAGVVGKEDAAERIASLLKDRTSEELKKGIAASGPDAINKFAEQVLGIQSTGFKPEENFATAAKTVLTKGMFDEYFTATPKDYEFGSEDEAARFKETVEKLVEVQNSLENLKTLNNIDERAFGDLNPEVNKDRIAMRESQASKLFNDLLAFKPVREKAQQFLAEKGKGPLAEKQKQDTEAAEAEKVKLLNALREKRNEALARLGIAEKESVAKTEEAARILKAKESFRLAIAAQDFANAIEAQIQGFKKAQMLAYEKQGSDIEGPFARVGQPGFKNQFEQRREELNKQGNRPFSLQEYQQRQTELGKVDFDEKEARIKMEQDREVAALRQQQGQAENIRETISSALIGGQLEGTGLEGMAKQYLDTLTDELVTSEQATMEGGELKFKGVPALEDSARFLAKIQEHAKEQARKAEKQFQQEVNKPMVDELTKQSGFQQQIVQNTSEMVKGVAGLVDKVQMPGSEASSSDQANFARSAQEAAVAGNAPEYGKNEKFEAEKYKQKLFSFNPTGMFDKQKAQEGPINLNEYLTEPGQKTVGVTNYNLETERRLRAKGLPKATSGSVVTDDSGRGTGSLSSTSARAADNPQLESQVELLQSILEAVGESQSLLGAIADTGLVVPDSLGSQIEGVGTSIVDALSDVLEVEITNQPVVTIDGLDDSLTSAFENSGLSGVGADVSDALGRLAVLETVVDPDGLPVTDLIAEATADIDAGIEENSLALADQDIRITSIEEQFDVLPDFDALVSTVDGLSSLTDDLEPRVSDLEAGQETLTTNVETLTGRVDEAESTVEEIRTDVADALTSIDASVAAVEGFETTIEEFDIRITAAEASVASLSDTTSAIQSSLIGLQTTVEQNKQLGDTNLRTQITRIDTNETLLASVEQTIRSIQTKTESAISVSNQALNRANQKT